MYTDKIIPGEPSKITNADSSDCLYMIVREPNNLREIKGSPGDGLVIEHYEDVNDAFRHMESLKSEYAREFNLDESEVFVKSILRKKMTHLIARKMFWSKTTPKHVYCIATHYY